MCSNKERVVVITGATGGIGFQSALEIAKTDVRLLITGRNPERGNEAVQEIIRETGNKRVELVLGDLSSIAGIDAVSQDILSRVEHIDVLVNNAGYFGNEPRKNDDGIEMHFAVNVLAPWRLTRALSLALEAAGNARVLNITGGDKPRAIDINNLQAEKGFKGLITYRHSKNAMEAVSLVLAENLKAQNISVNVLFPGRAATAMTGGLSPSALPGVLKLFYPLFKVLFKDDGGKSAAKAARSTIWAATTPELDGLTGRYFNGDMKEHKLDPTAYQAETQDAILALIKSAEAGALGSL